MVINTSGDDDESTPEKAPTLGVYEVTDSRGQVITLKLTEEQAKERGAKKVSGTGGSAKARSTTTKARKPDDK